jgi:hypothetical protein
LDSIIVITDKERGKVSPNKGFTPLGNSLGGGKPRKGSRRKALLIIAGLSPIPLVGIVLAANVTITGTGGANVVEFGQGSASATACDTTLTTTLNTTYNGTTFMLSSIVLSDVNGTSGNCLNKAITVSPASDATTLGSAVVTPTATPGNTAGTYTLTPTPSVTASAVTKVLIQTQ